MALAAAAVIPHLEAWLPGPAVRTHRRRAAAAAPEALWRAAREIRLTDTRTLGRLVRWRIPDTPPRQTYYDLFCSYPFTILEEGQRHLVSGLCGRIWTLQRDYPSLADAEAFRRWDEPGTVRVLFANWVTEAGDGRSELCSEARIEPVDRVARLRLNALWALIGRFEPLVAAEPLTAAARTATAR